MAKQDWLSKKDPQFLLPPVLVYLSLNFCVRFVVELMLPQVSRSGIQDIETGVIGVSYILLIRNCEGQRS